MGILDIIQPFEANPRLRKVGQKVGISKEQVKEYLKCANDPVYFAENYVKIITIDKGAVPFAMFNFQKKMIRSFHTDNRVIVKAARQSGKTSTCAAYLLWYVLFNADKTAAILANKELTATEILGRVQEMYMNVPLWMQQGIVEWNKRSFTLENKSRIMSSATGSNAIRGFTINLLVLDEFAFVPASIAHEFFTSVFPTLSSGKTSKLIICSTPRGMNSFYKLFTDAEKGRNGFKAITVTWDKVPGRNKKWADEQRKVLGDEKFEQEMNVEFMGSAGTLISAKALKSLTHDEPLRQMLDSKLKMYQDVIPGHRYVLCADCSHGKELDFSAVSVIDVTTMPYQIAAVYHSNDIPAELYPNVLVQIGNYYNKAYALIENNDIGSLVIKILLDDLEYENVFYTDRTISSYSQVELSGKTIRSPGLKTTSKSKRQGCNALKQLIENEQLRVNDFETISELTTFIVRNNKTYAADDDCHDDLVMTLVLFGWLTTQTFFKDLANSDPRKAMYRERSAQIEQEMPVAPFMSGPVMGERKVRIDNVIWDVVEPDGDGADNRWSGYSTLN